MKIKKLKAYTLLEITVAMLVASLVISVTYTAYGIIDRSYRRYMETQDKVAELQMLDRALRQDFLRATLIHGEGNSVTFSDSSGRTSYLFDEHYIIRSRTGQDTFRLRAGQLLLQFKSLPLATADAPGDNAPGTGALLDELSFTLLENEGEIYYHYHKQYSSENLFNQPPNAIH